MYVATTLESLHQGGILQRGQNVLLWQMKKDYLIIIIKTPSDLVCSTICGLQLHKILNISMNNHGWSLYHVTWD